MALRAPVTCLSMASTKTVSSSRIEFCMSPTNRPSFFGSGVAPLKVRGIQLAHPRSVRCNSVQMSLLDRVSRVFKSYVEALISSFEDPEKILEQAVHDMNEELAKMRQATAQVFASQKMMEKKYESAEEASEEWYKRAQSALLKGDEDLAREALMRRKMYADNAVSLKTELVKQKGVTENLINNIRLLESKIQEAKSNKDTLKARAQSAKTTTKVNEMLANVDTSSALSAFARMEEKVNSMEFIAAGPDRWVPVNDTKGKVPIIESTDIDEDLASLKKKLFETTKKGELPPGRTTVSNSKEAYPFPDPGVEKELNDLRERTEDF
uniref:probable membrane-associated 30 kDa protein, chloroplastic n=1 Tax=Erigeron canadensis TaxID=72917 RepID=UPI001CB8E482|nr:probable membrane-associated 30 kDa protein, chloroplastic [Erigeron canadensis]